MSHFTVLIIGTAEADNLLAPYDEHIEFPPYIKFTREDKAAERKRRIKEYKQTLHSPLVLYEAAKIATNLRELQNMTDEEYFERETQFYGESALNTAGEPISTYNPNTKWNSWEYEPWLLLKKTSLYSTTAMKQQINWKKMSDRGMIQAAASWNRMRLNSYTDSQRRLLFDLWDGETKKQYMDRKREFLTHAYILRGKWYEHGRIGWWGGTIDQMKREDWIKQYTDMLRSLKNDAILTTVKCHI